MVAVKAAPAAPPSEAPAAAVQEKRGHKVQVVASDNTQTLSSTTDMVTVGADKSNRDVHSANSTDSGIADEFDDNKGIITENTDGGENVASQARPVTPDLELAGQGYHESQTSLRQATRESSATSAMSHSSTITTQSAPSILERPKSRGGCAFDVVYDEGNSRKLPTRLQAIDKRRLSQNKHKHGISREATLAELEEKLAAAERRRAEYERRVKAKMAEEAEKVDNAGRSLTRQKSNLDAEIVKNENKATENRERHLKQLRDKLKAKEKKAKQVRQNKERLAKEATREGSAVKA